MTQDLIHNVMWKNKFPRQYPLGTTLVGHRGLWSHGVYVGTALWERHFMELHTPLQLGQEGESLCCCGFCLVGGVFSNC